MNVPLEPPVIVKNTVPIKGVAVHQSPGLLEARCRKNIENLGEVRGRPRFPVESLFPQVIVVNKMFHENGLKLLRRIFPRFKDTF